MRFIVNVFMTLLLVGSVSLVYWAPNIVRVMRTGKTMKYVCAGLGVLGCFTGALTAFIILQESIDPTHLLMGLMVMALLMGVDKARAVARAQKLRARHQECNVTLEEAAQAMGRAGNIIPLPVSSNEVTAEIELPKEIRQARH